MLFLGGEMKQYKIIGNMTGNSMDAIDLVLTEFCGDKMTDICTYSRPYSMEMRAKIEELREIVFNKTRQEIEKIPEFFAVCGEYVSQVAESINQMCAENEIDKNTIDAIGFHGKTLDHNPPSMMSGRKTSPYTLQMGSGQMLADLTGIKVIYDFRSDYIMNGFEGAPLAAPHNARISLAEGGGCYFNGGNTSNFAIIENGRVLISTDAGPFNEYTDNFVRQNAGCAFDADGRFGKKGRIDERLLQFLFDIGREFYETRVPKSGDPAYYRTKEVFEYVRRTGVLFYDVVRTFEYFAAYGAVYALTLVPESVKIPENIILFGGGWKNPVVQESFYDLLVGRGIILTEHRERFFRLSEQIKSNVKVKYSHFGEYMEARLFADMARYRLEGKVWELPEVMKSEQNIVCGRIALPEKCVREKYDDCICRAAKGWQFEK